jgi:hypothetical protein
VPVPMPDVWLGWTSMRVASMTGLDFRMPRGYFMGPKDPPDDLTASWWAPPRYTSGLFVDVRRTGVAPDMSGWRRRLVRADLRYWRAGVVVLLPSAVQHDALRATLTPVLGPPRRAGGVEFWDVRTLS